MNEGSPAQWLAAAQKIDARIEKLRPEADRLVVGQHVISQVLPSASPLRSAAVGSSWCPSTLTTPTVCTRWQVRASAARSRTSHASPLPLWNSSGASSRHGYPTPRAVDRGDVFQHEHHVQTLKDLIALHLVRSLNYRKVHERIFAKVYTEHRTALLTDKSDLLRLAVLQRSGLHLSGPQGLAAAADQILSPHLENFENGADFRARIEDTFAKAKEMISDAGLEILVPADGEFLLGDTPALAIQQSETGTAFNVAIGDSTAIVLPFGPRHLLVGRTPRNGLSIATEETVSFLDRLQIEAAEQRVYLRPRSGLDAIVRRYLKQGIRRARS